jgi:hypothetical protein
MTILLRWLVDKAGFVYIGCAVGGFICMMYALSARRKRDLAVFTLEREAATLRMVRSWTLVAAFLAAALIFFVSATFVLPALPFYNSDDWLATPTLAAGVETPAVNTLTPTVDFMVPTLTPSATSAMVPTPPPPDTLTPSPVPTPVPVVSGETNVRFGNFAQLVGFSLPGTEVTTAQPLMLTLYWQALGGSGEINYMVFTHLLAETGEVHLVGQDDDHPADGTRLTTGWVAGASIEDVHPMVFVDPGYVGAARIEVGLYDPFVPSDRVLTDLGSDRAVLPITINIVSRQ